MIVCSCNVIHADEIRRVARHGCRDADSAYAALGYRLQCGGCEDHVEDLIDCERARNSLKNTTEAA